MMLTNFQARSPLAVTLSVWRALLLREALTRISGGRMPWVWLLLEPVAHMAFLVFIFSVISHHVIAGIPTQLFIISGMLAYFFFQRPATQCMNALSANAALFTYRQVKPVDTILVRAVLECILMLMISVIVFLGASLTGLDVLPEDPLRVYTAVTGLTLLGLGYGLVTSVLVRLVSEAGKIIGILMTPLYLISGVIMPISVIPIQYREYLIYNPVVHGLESTRLGFSSYYHAIPELDVSYLYFFAFSLIIFGLMLHRRFAERLLAQ